MAVTNMDNLNKQLIINDLVHALEQIQVCLREAMPGNDQSGKEDFFILYPTMQPIAVIAAAAISKAKLTALSHT